MVRSLWKLFLFSLIVIGFICHTTAIVFLNRDLVRRRRLTQQATQRWIGRTLRVFCVRVEVDRPELLEKTRPALIVANHISTLDILTIYSLVDSTFVTSVEVERDLFAGTLSARAGALFVERRSPAFLRREISRMAAVLSSGFRVVLFPEGTTTDGRSALLPFKTAFFSAAIEAQVPILPLCIRYLTLNGQPIAGEAFDRIAYYGDMTLFCHIRSLLTLREVHIRVEVLDPVEAESRDRREMGNFLRERIGERLQGR